MPDHEVPVGGAMLDIAMELSVSRSLVDHLDRADRADFVRHARGGKADKANHQGQG
jgi:hypothetical protein